MLKKLAVAALQAVATSNVYRLSLTARQPSFYSSGATRVQQGESRIARLPAILRKGNIMDESMKNWIDDASYEDLLSKWRFAPVGSPYFQGEIGKYYTKVMAEKRSQVGNTEHVKASKSIGW